MLATESSFLGTLNYIFCDDAYLVEINLQYLNHNTLTDIITFDYSDESRVSGDIFISIERVRDNAKDFKVGFEEELKRVMSHGVLHLLGYNDKTDEEKHSMRNKENEMIKLFHVEQ
jgi:rRNA maturation RNase YbeY